MLQDVTVKQHNSDVHNGYSGEIYLFMQHEWSFVLHEAWTKRHMQSISSWEFVSRARRGALDTILFDNMCQWLAKCKWFSSVSSTKKTVHHDITDILFK